MAQLGMESINADILCELARYAGEGLLESMRQEEPAKNFDEFIRVRRLSWAGVQICVENTTLLIDPLENIPKGAGVAGKPHTKIATSAPKIDAALITHMRDDHYDVRLLAEKLKPGGHVLCPAGVAPIIAADGFEVTGLQNYETTRIGLFMVTALPAVDGLGDDQISFLIEVDGVKILHCGDTLWHGYWYKFAQDHGPINVAFLPVNGAQINVPGVPPTGQPVTMTPPQAAAAADIICAEVACPIHYGMFNHPPGFVEWPHSAAVFMTEAEKRDVPARLLEPGEEMLLDRVPPSAD
jgi:L-ascorbate metabolism protein UlaG (beta-lactamase superfamily)